MLACCSAPRGPRGLLLDSVLLFRGQISRQGASAYRFCARLVPPRAPYRRLLSCKLRPARAAAQGGQRLPFAGPRPPSSAGAPGAVAATAALNAAAAAEASARGPLGRSRDAVPRGEGGGVVTLPTCLGLLVCNQSAWTRTPDSAEPVPSPCGGQSFCSRAGAD